ncbi:large subunit rRNA methyltransferase [Acrasis kona]|uniref:Large subunit rRNA methyltransferase n=1 Tax=Acrasis kona TaxID=1008807 RepID=A0AAW2YNJ0_9EUKA
MLPVGQNTQTITTQAPIQQGLIPQQSLIQQQPTSQFALGSWEHDNHLWEQRMVGAQQSLGNNFNRDSWISTNPAPLRQSYPVTTTQTIGGGLLDTERTNLMQHESKLAGQGALLNPLERQNLAIHEKAVENVLSHGNIGGGAPTTNTRPAF